MILNTVVETHIDQLNNNISMLTTQIFKTDHAFNKIQIKWYSKFPTDTNHTHKSILLISGCLRFSEIYTQFICLFYVFSSVYTCWVCKQIFCHIHCTHNFSHLCESSCVASAQ